MTFKNQLEWGLWNRYRETERCATFKRSSLCRSVGIKNDFLKHSYQRDLLTPMSEASVGYTKSLQVLVCHFWSKMIIL